MNSYRGYYYKYDLVAAVITYITISLFFSSDSEKPDQHLPSDLLVRFKTIFRQGLWAATAFKGATSSCALIPTIKTHVENHLGKD